EEAIAFACVSRERLGAQYDPFNQARSLSRSTRQGSSVISIVIVRFCLAGLARGGTGPDVHWVHKHRMEDLSRDVSWPGFVLRTVVRGIGFLVLGLVPGMAVTWVLGFINPNIAFAYWPVALFVGCLFAAKSAYRSEARRRSPSSSLGVVAYSKVEPEV